MSNFSKLYTDKLVVGTTDVSFLPGDVNEGLVANGPVFFGIPPSGPVPLATVNMGPPAPPSLPSLNALAKFIFTENKLGVFNALGTALFSGLKKALGIKLHTGLKQQTGLNSQTGAKLMTGLAFSGTLVYQPGHALPAKKNFDIVHPTKPGHRLRYVCVETPEAGVYIRGKSTNNIIELPDYWIGLVHQESISVNLTPIGCHQNLYVEKVEDNKIYVNGDAILNYYYTIFAERKDCEINIPEYEGQTPADYPGDQEQCSVAGYDY